MFKDIEYRENENLAKHTTLHIGGNARWFLLPKDEIELEAIIYECKLLGIEFFILGAGSNLLVSDDGFNGAVISMENFADIKLCEHDRVKVGSGVNLFTLNIFCEKNNLSGLEWSYGIPGSVGGASKMNASAFGGEFCKQIVEIEVFNGVSIKKRKNISFAYRKGCLRKNEILISATLKLQQQNKQQIKERHLFYLKQRQKLQPYGVFSLGSVFKRGKNFIPAKLIDEFGLKGLCYKDIEISKKHAGFIVNKGRGKAEDFLKMVKHIEQVAMQKGYVFEREFISIGFEE